MHLCFVVIHKPKAGPTYQEAAGSSQEVYLMEEPTPSVVQGPEIHLVELIRNANARAPPQIY